MYSTVVKLRKGEGRTIKSGGAWVYDNEIDTITGRFENGDVVSVVDFDDYPMGNGFINQNSKIRIRMLTRDVNQEIDRAFLYSRVKAAWDYRKVTMDISEDKSTDNSTDSASKNSNNCCRIIFGEADFLPGLVVDKYRDILVVESLALGIDKLKRIILEELINVLSEDGIKINGIYERSDAPVRKKEGLMPYKGCLYYKGEWIVDNSIENVTSEEIFNYFKEIDVVENNIHYKVDVINGQKTGFFLDQKYNRRAMQKLCSSLIVSKAKSLNTSNDKLKILDCFTHMGTFALNCGYAIKKSITDNDIHIDDIGSKIEVTGLDISEFAVMQATNNAKNNNLDEIVKFRAANVLDELPKLNSTNEKYDVVILDPPAFTKSKEATKNAIKGYREINMKGLKLVKDGGYFATCSCSHFMTQELFTKVISQAAQATHKRLRQIEFRTQGPDHPILWSADESYYLKFLIFQVVEEK